MGFFIVSDIRIVSSKTVFYNVNRTAHRITIIRVLMHLNTLKESNDVRKLEERFGCSITIQLTAFSAACCADGEWPWQGVDKYSTSATHQPNRDETANVGRTGRRLVLSESVMH
jgi:hypothetical protein